MNKTIDTGYINRDNECTQRHTVLTTHEGNAVNTLFILIALTFSNGQMYDYQVTGNIWKSSYDCMVEYKKLSKHQSNNTKFVCMAYDGEVHK